MWHITAIVACVMWSFVGAAYSQGCGGPVACTLPEGRYRIVLPEGELRGAYLFFHGYQSSAEQMMQNTSMITTVTSRGLALVLPDGVSKNWSFPGSPAAARDDLAFVSDVLDDLHRRFGVRRDRVVVGGFSLGASMAWYAVCADGDRFLGAVTFAGVFWRPLPASCAGRIPPFVHIHGNRDRTFPLEGRAIGGAHHQGSTLDSIALLRSEASCSRPARRVAVGALACDTSDCADGGPVTLCLHGGGHEIRSDWLAEALRHIGM